MKLYLSIVSTNTGDRVALSKSPACISSKCWAVHKYSTKKCYSISEFDLDSAIERYNGDIPANPLNIPVINTFIATVINIAMGRMIPGKVKKIFHNDLAYDKYCHVAFICADCDEVFNVILRHIMKLYSVICGTDPVICDALDKNTPVLVCGEPSSIVGPNAIIANNTKNEDHSEINPANNNMQMETDDYDCASNRGNDCTGDHNNTNNTNNNPNYSPHSHPAEENPHVLIEKLRMAVLRIENELNEKLNLITDYKKDAEKFREVRAMFANP